MFSSTGISVCPAAVMPLPLTGGACSSFAASVMVMIPLAENNLEWICIQIRNLV